MTKEEIQAQLQIIEDLLPFIPVVYMFDLNLRVLKLRKDYEEAKSIQDLQKEAFEAARSSIEGNFNYRYETFENYLKNSD